MEKSKRLFVGIPIPPDIQSFLNQKLGDLHQKNDLIHWTPKEHYHITLHFLGDTSTDELINIEGTLSDSIINLQKFDLVFTQFIFFPQRRPYMVWLRAKENLLFNSLQTAIQHGFNVQQQVQKSPIPHITLARFKNPKIAKSLELPVLEEKAVTLQVNSIVLWESILQPAGAHYKKLNTFYL